MRLEEGTIDLLLFFQWPTKWQFKSGYALIIMPKHLRKGHECGLQLTYIWLHCKYSAESGYFKWWQAEAADFRIGYQVRDSFASHFSLEKWMERLEADKLALESSPRLATAFTGGCYAACTSNCIGKPAPILRIDLDWLRSCLKGPQAMEHLPIVAFA